MNEQEERVAMDAIVYVLRLQHLFTIQRYTGHSGEGVQKRAFQRKATLPIGRNDVSVDLFPFSCVIGPSVPYRFSAGFLDSHSGVSPRFSFSLTIRSFYFWFWFSSVTTPCALLLQTTKP
jgi:hypothetical protein